MTNPTARTYADALAAAQAMHPTARPTVCDCADPRPVPASTPGRAVCARCSREWVTAEPASDRTAVPADQRPAVGDAFRVVLVGPSFGRVGRVVAAGVVDMVDGGSPSGLVDADMVRITPDAYVAARLAAADPRGGAQRAVEASRADERADTEPSPARGPLSPSQSTEGTQYVPAAVCSDCLVWAANADDSGAGPDWSPRVYANGLDLLGAASLIADGDEQGFQWAECPVCRVGGGGDRYAATLVIEPSTAAWQRVTR